MTKVLSDSWTISVSKIEWSPAGVKVTGSLVFLSVKQGPDMVPHYEATSLSEPFTFVVPVSLLKSTTKLNELNINTIISLMEQMFNKPMVGLVDNPEDPKDETKHRIPPSKRKP